MQLLFPQVPQTLSARSSNQKQQKINNFAMKLLKKQPTFLQVFLQSLLWNCFVKTVLYCGTRIGRKSFWCFATLSAKFRLLSKAAKTPSCWKRCCQQRNEPMSLLAKGAKFQRRIRDQSVQLDPLAQEISLFQLVAGNSISSKMVFSQPSKAKKTLQKGLQNYKCFFTLFCPSLLSYNTCKCNLGQVGRKTTWCFATLSAKFCLHSKAAKTPCCWKCCCQQQNEPINLLAKGGAISTRNSGPKCSIGPPRARNFIVSACCW